MKNPRFICRYEHDGKEIQFEGKNSEFLDAEYSVTDESIKLTLKPKALVELLEARFVFEHDFNDNDRFFANGYQSWTTSREYMKNDLQEGINPLISKVHADRLAGISADVWFCDDERTNGIFRSHCYTYIKNSEKYLLIGSLSEKQGYTVIRGDMTRNTVTISKDIEGVLLTGEEYPLYDIAILSGSEDDVFDRYFELMGVKKPRIDRLAGYTSWYNYFQKINESIITRDLNALDKVRDSVNVFQIDDGYETFVGDWLDPNPAKFPSGMKAMADRIHDKGYMAGLWLAPFSVQIKSRTYKEHPDWVIKDKNDKPLLGCASWGGAYTLDIYNPEVREHLKHVFDVVLNDWGYDMVKLDFLYSQCQMPRNNKSRGTIMCEAMDFLRECCGDKIILGCGVPLGAAFGKVDACRIGCDVDLKFSGKYYNKLKVNNELPSVRNALTNTVFRRQLNGRAFINDPDVFFFRYSNLKFSIEQKILLAFVNHICGDVLFVSDNMEEYYDDDVEAAKKIFAKSECKILDANIADDNRKMVIKLKDGRKDNSVRMLWFNFDNGFGNQTYISGIFAKR